jgi:hypothetical protein
MPESAAVSTDEPGGLEIIKIKSKHEPEPKPKSNPNHRPSITPHLSHTENDVALDQVLALIPVIIEQHAWRIGVGADVVTRHHIVGVLLDLEAWR